MGLGGYRLGASICRCWPAMPHGEGMRSQQSESTGESGVCVCAGRGEANSW